MVQKALICFIGLFAICSYAQAQVPGTLSYQGILTDNSGVPVTDGVSVVTFNFYSVATGGTAIAGATRGPINVTTSKGLFTVVIGDGTANNAALPGTLFNTEFWIGITVGVAGTELTPRVRMTAVPYAYRAQVANTLDAAATVVSSQITDGTIVTADLANSSVTAAKLATNAVSGGVGGIITDASITTADVADASITAPKLAASAVSGGVGGIITDASITTADVADASITAPKLAASAVSGGVGGVITDASITTADVADGSITNVKLAAGIDAGKINTGTLTLTGTDATKLATGTTAQRPAGIEGQLRYNSTEKVMEYFNGTNWYFTAPKIAFLKEIFTSGTNGGNGGSMTGGNVFSNVRNLNTIEGDNTVVSLDPVKHEFTLQPGEYIIEAVAPAFHVDRHKIRLSNPLGTVTYGVGSSEYCAFAGYEQTSSTCYAKVSIGGVTTFVIQHAAFSGSTSGALGYGSGFAENEVYTQVKITKLR